MKADLTELGGFKWKTWDVPQDEELTKAQADDAEKETVIRPFEDLLHDGNGTLLRHNQTLAGRKKQCKRQSEVLS